ncbi:glycosyltransferase family 4 protein [Paenibacillus sp. LHD-38]|uniref:glycosyltransferase family 4 protein n=1 Tax=Paenibacillus sp. LHD-38 TaxID=3072143 RepID=UPI00280DC4B7|nr:glycosyltransferase family 4 protein [Paenibacillus sp. LHD-38]MDQ8738349.1 glycosyltransferase family 4 protein [Paenibacillus sp. LHD-38]
MRIIIIRSNPILPDPRVEKEANTLLRLGYKVKLIAWNRQVINKREKTGEIKVKYGILPIRWFNINASYGNGLKSLFPLLLFQLCILGWLVRNRKEYDIIHACDFDTVIPVWICAKLFKKKYVYDIFDYYVDAFHVPGFLKPIVEKIDTVMINSANAVIIVNESRIEQISKSKPRKLYIIHNSPDISNLIVDDENIAFRNEKLKVVYIGILSSGRLLKETLKVFQAHQEWELHIGGFGPYEDYIKEIAESNNNIIYYGRIPYERVIAIEQKCDVLFATYDPDVPNHRYSSPNKLYEAMILGKPIIVANGTGIDVIVRNFEIGKAIDYNAESFEKALEEISEERKKWSSITNRIQSIYNAEYSWDIMNSRLKDLYMNL